jgi:hypothetical protein
MPDTLATVEFTATLDARRALTVIEALEMLVGVAQSYGHRFTPEQMALLDRASEACESRSLVITAGRD